ncbi:MAG: RidA family protein [Spirochaetes bacterium]|nr:RidA family protein [Spirochaetota bacterium]
MQIIETDKAPKAIGPYSQAIKHNDFIFTAGQLGIDPATGKLIDDTIESQTEQTMKNLNSILKEAKASFSNVIETTIFLTDLNNFKIVNEIYAKHLNGHKPARVTVQVAGLPLGGKIEIKMTAVV